MGVQSVYEDVARDTNRGHTVRAVCESFQLAKDAGFKVRAIARISWKGVLDISSARAKIFAATPTNYIT